MRISDALVIKYNYRKEEGERKGCAFFFPLFMSRGECIIPISINQKLTGRVKLAFFQDDPESERHQHSGRCGWLWGWLDRLMTRLTLYWIAQDGYDYGHVEMMFSDGTVVSATENGGVHVLTNKLLSNDGYTKILSVKVTPEAEEFMLEKAEEVKGAPFNKLGRLWNNVGILKTITIIDAEEQRFYCSELVTYLLQIGAGYDGSSMCGTLDHRTTNPTQLFLYLSNTGYGKIDFNEKEARARGMNVAKTSGFLSGYMFGKKGKGSSMKLI